MSFNDIVGHKWITDGLQNSIVNKSIVHAFLFTGMDGVGKFTTAKKFAQALNCDKQDGDSCGKCYQCRAIDSGNHPDLTIVGISEDSRIIKMEDVKLIHEAAALTISKGRHKVFIIEDADKLGIEAANSLLKILEEPPELCVLILTAPSPEAVLPTILSRCQVIRFGKLPEEFIVEKLQEEFEIDKSTAQSVACFADGSIGRARELFSDDLIEMNNWVIDNLSDLKKNDVMDLSQDALALLKGWRGAKLAGNELRLVIFYFLDFVSVFFRDAAVLSECGEAGKIYNKAFIEQIMPLAKSIGYDKLNDVVQRIQETHALVDLNVNVDLAIENMFLDLEKLVA